MQTDEIRKAVLEVLCGVVHGADAHNVDPKVSFRDQFEIDSVDFLNLVLQLETRFDLQVPETDYPRLSNLEGCVEYFGPKAATGSDG